MKALITGDSGFVGQHLRQYLEANDYDVFGFDIKNGFDIRDYESVRVAVDFYRPDKIFHLAALTYVPESFADPKRAFEINTFGSINVLEAVKNMGLKTRIHLAGTCEEENPSSPYTAAKLAMTTTAMTYARNGMDIVVTRAHNHTGPGKSEEFAESSFAKQIAQIERGEREFIKHGSLTAMRNFTDVADMVRAYEVAIDLPSGIYTICSDRNVSMQTILDILIGQSTAKIETRIDSNLVRNAQTHWTNPDCAEFKELTGWEATIPLELTLGSLLQDWRERLI